jgi:hypothetical protein
MTGRTRQMSVRGCPESFRIDVGGHKFPILEFLHYAPVAVAFETLLRLTRMTPFFCAHGTEIEHRERQEEQKRKNHLSHLTLPIKGSEAKVKRYPFDSGSITCFKYRVTYRPLRRKSLRKKDTFSTVQMAHTLMGLLISRF